MEKSYRHHGEREEDRVLKEMLKIAANAEAEDRALYRRLAKKAKIDRDKKLLYAIADEKKRRHQEVRRIYASLFRRELPRGEKAAAPCCGFREGASRAMIKEKDNAGFYREILTRVPSEKLKGAVSHLADDEGRYLRILEKILNGR